MTNEQRRNNLDPAIVFADWPTTYTRLFGGQIDAVTFAADGMGYVVYREPYNALGDPAERVEIHNGVAHRLLKERLAWPIEFIDAALASGDEPWAVRFLYDATWRIRNAQSLRLGSFAGWVQEESSRARDLSALMKEYKAETIDDLLGIGGTNA